MPSAENGGRLQLMLKKGKVFVTEKAEAEHEERALKGAMKEGRKKEGRKEGRLFPRRK